MSTQNASSDHVPPLDAIGTTTAQPRSRVNWGLWLQWMWACGFGWAFGVVLYAAFIFAAVRVLNQAFVGIVLASLGTLFGGSFGGLIAVSLGSMQGLLLRQHGYSTRTFTFASLRGGLIGGSLSAVAILGALIVQIWPSSADTVLALGVMLMLGAGAITGAAIGYRQGVLLHNKRLTRSQWGRVNAMAWAAGCAISAIVGQIAFDDIVWPVVLPFRELSSAILLSALWELSAAQSPAFHSLACCDNLQSLISNPKSKTDHEPTSPHLG